MMNTPIAISSQPEIDAALTENPSARCACMLVLDTSSSMAGAPIAELNAGLQAFIAAVCKDEVAAYAVELGVITAGSAVCQLQSPGPVSTIDRCDLLEAEGAAPLGLAVQRALDQLADLKSRYQANGVAYHRPWLIIISNGEPTDAWQAAAAQSRALSEQGHLVVVPIGMQGANLDILGQFSSRPVKQLDCLKFREFFAWLSASMSRVSASSPTSDSITLPGTGDWDAIGEQAQQPPVADPETPTMTPLPPTVDSQAASIEPEPPEAPLPAPQADPAPVPVVRTPGNWFVQEEAVVGLAHRVKNLPCQDAAQAVSRPRTALVLADGAGSSAVSEIGARAVVRSTVRLLDTLDKPLSAWLDQDSPEPQQQARTWGLLLVKHAIGTLKDLAAEHRRELRDFRSTFLVVVAGRRRLFWLKIGDGAIVLEKRRLQADTQGHWGWVHELCTLGELGKGEFANQTQFLDGIAPDEVQIGCLDVEAVSGLALMSDGAAERLVANDGSRVAPRISTLLAQLRQDKLRRSALTRMFYEEDFCTGTSGDDRSIALAACEDPAIENRTPSAPASTPTPPAAARAPTGDRAGKRPRRR